MYLIIQYAHGHFNNAWGDFDTYMEALEYRDRLPKEWYYTYHITLKNLK